MLRRSGVLRSARKRHRRLLDVRAWFVIRVAMNVWRTTQLSRIGQRRPVVGIRRLLYMTIPERPIGEDHWCASF